MKYLLQKLCVVGSTSECTITYCVSHWCRQQRTEAACLQTVPKHGRNSYFTHQCGTQPSAVLPYRKWTHIWCSAGAKFGHCSHFCHDAVVLDENQVLCSKLYIMNTLNIDASHLRLSMHVTSTSVHPRECFCLAPPPQHPHSSGALSVS